MSILIDVKENISGQLYYISLCNVHDGDDAYIDLYFSKDISLDYFENRRNIEDGVEIEQILEILQHLEHKQLQVLKHLELLLKYNLEMLMHILILQLQMT